MKSIQLQAAYKDYLWGGIKSKGTAVSTLMLTLLKGRAAKK